MCTLKYSCIGKHNDNYSCIGDHNVSIGKHKDNYQKKKNTKFVRLYSCQFHYDIERPNLLIGLSIYLPVICIGNYNSSTGSERTCNFAKVKD